MSRWRFDRNRFLSREVDATWITPPPDLEEFHRSLPGFTPTPLVSRIQRRSSATSCAVSGRSSGALARHRRTR